MSKIEYNEKVFDSRSGKNAIYDAVYCGAPCFAVVHVPTGHTEIVDHNESIVKAIISRIKRSTAMTCDKKTKGYILKFYPTKTERRITLRYYVYAKYNELRLNQVRSKNICLYDDSSVKDNILDLRSSNLYGAGDIRAHTKARDIKIVDRPNSGEKYIAITFQNRANGKTEYTEYSPQLYEMLARPAYCNIEYNSRGDRATVVVHYANNKDGYVRDNLAKFILIYNLHFGRYKNMSGGVRRFIRDYYGLSREKYSGREAAHINACKWNNCFNNLMFMDCTEENNPNKEMRDYIKWVSAPYGAYAAANNKGEILIEFTGIGLSRGGKPTTRYYKCSSPEDYADWQKVLLGKTLTKKLQVATYATTNGIQQELTPSGMIKVGRINKETAKWNEPDLWVWLEHKDKLLSMDDNAFYRWRAGAGRTINGVPMPEEIAVGKSFLVPFRSTYAVLTPLKINSEE